MPSEYGQFVKIYKSKEEKISYNDGVKAAMETLKFCLDKKGYTISGLEQIEKNCILEVGE